MNKANIHELKNHLSEYLDSVIEKGEPLVICRRNIPVAEIFPIAQRKSEPRPIGLAKNENGFEILDSFHLPLPDEMLEAFQSPL